MFPLFEQPEYLYTYTRRFFTSTYEAISGDSVEGGKEFDVLAFSYSKNDHPEDLFQNVPAFFNAQPVGDVNTKIEEVSMHSVKEIPGEIKHDNVKNAIRTPSHHLFRFPTPLQEAHYIRDIPRLHKKHYDMQLHVGRITGSALKIQINVFDTVKRTYHDWNVRFYQALIEYGHPFVIDNIKCPCCSQKKTLYFSGLGYGNYYRSMGREYICISCGSKFRYPSRNATKLNILTHLIQATADMGFLFINPITRTVYGAHFISPATELYRLYTEKRVTFKKPLAEELQE